MKMKFFLPLAIRRSVGGWWHDRKKDLEKRALLASLEGSGAKCNVCTWEGRAFADDCWHPGTICPECGSQVRHRMLVAVFDGLSATPGFDEQSLLVGKAILHFAPERQLRDRISRAATTYASADFDRGDCDLRLDISAMPQVEDICYDVLIACDVFEHVLNDAAGFREIHRVLKPGGLAILTVPQRDPPSRTDEDPQVKSEDEREKRFGQKDHVRMYGDDFPDRLEAAGFSVLTVDAESFPPQIRSAHILNPPIVSARPLATNHRRLYFARKVT